MPRSILILASLITAISLCSCARSDDASRETPRPATRPAPAAFAPIRSPHLHNAHRVTDKVLSGAQPDDEAAFETLAALGVKTIISVDGAKPDVDGARRHGIRYVHLPIGYNGVTREQGLAIAKAIDELPGPIYIHCHHGKHRSAAATAVACIYNGSLDPDQADAVLVTFGTGANYTGLWRDARNAERVAAETLRDLNIPFPETAPIPPLADAMVSIDRHWEHLKLLRKNDWQRVPSHPDLDPAHEALQLLEHFTELARTGDATAKPQDFQRRLAESQAASQTLRAALAADALDRTSAQAAFQRIGQGCSSCHKAHRD